MFPFSNWAGVNLNEHSWGSMACDDHDMDVVAQPASTLLPCIVGPAEKTKIDLLHYELHECIN